MDEILKKINVLIEKSNYELYKAGLEDAKEIILSQQKSKGSVIIALSEGEYIHRCLNCNHQIMSISGSLNFCPTCGKAVEPLHMANGEIVFTKRN